MMRKFPENVEWGKYRVVKWVWPCCVCVSVLWLTTSISYDSSAGTLSPVRKQIPCIAILSYGPRHKQKYPHQKKIHACVTFRLFWCPWVTERVYESGCARLYLHRGLMLAACRTDAGLVGVTSTDMLSCSAVQMTKGGGGRWGRSCEKRSKKRSPSV